ncbi:hypothetical protein PLANPX_3820 [Lacipirellula parvula]|uniref:Uncharacterized protein n=1 Tax=Lacipirellula parvula TaxID=2650471 RepID=A0A5K7XCM0_9BACT|nr:hypothetical protein PLANPX_3820 [Lacipirellula parvula]
MSNCEGNQPSHRVWEFKGDGRTWIAWAVGHDPPEPTPGSAASRAFDSLTPCNELAPSSMLDKAAAIALARLIKGIRRGQGLEVLAGRAFGGSGPIRPAGGCRSLRALARMLGCSRRQASKYAGFDDYDGRSGRSGSDYDDRP